MKAPSKNSKTTGKLAEYRKKRDFEKTAEPRGGDAAAEGGGLSFIVQKHRASHLHYDLRLEVEGVMKSWAVPKGPSLDPSVKRLAVEVEDHPMEYNSFEGAIPKGEYGGGTVMLWDRGSYEVELASAEDDPEQVMAAGIAKGRVTVTFHGERLKGAFVLIRTKKAGEKSKATWILKKIDDASATADVDLTEVYQTSVKSARTMDEIMADKPAKKTKGVAAAQAEAEPPKPKVSKARARPSSKKKALKTNFDDFSPMLLSLAEQLPEGDAWVYEPKWDGMRAIAICSDKTWALVSRNGNNKAKQFPEIGAALMALSQSIGQAFVLDGEVIGIGPDGEALRFESLQERMTSDQLSFIEREARERPAAYKAFDLLLLGEESLIQEPLRSRRKILEKLLAKPVSHQLQLSESSSDAEELLRRSKAARWEGIVAKLLDSAYEVGVRSKAWIKWKLERNEELIVGGWKERAGAKDDLASLLLGYYDASGRLHYGGLVGTGFDRQMRKKILTHLKELEQKRCPFHEDPAEPGTVHWVKPQLLVQVKFNEVTASGRLRQASFQGLRLDKKAKEVVIEPEEFRKPALAQTASAVQSVAARPPTKAGKKPAQPRAQAAAASIDASLKAIEAEGGDGEISLAQGRLRVSHLQKIFYPKQKYSKGDLLRYYAEMSPYILPWMKDRPLVLKRYPNGIEGKSFYQQNAEEQEHGVRTERIEWKGEEEIRFVGGDLLTLLHTIQLGAISYDPWHSRFDALTSADYTIVDLDPTDGTSFKTVCKVALSCLEAMDEYGLRGAVKTSGASGIHIYLPLPPETPIDGARLLAEIVATHVARAYPKLATVERSVAARPRGTVYMDYMQNYLGKSVAGLWAVRAVDGAGVSTPIDWKELKAGDLSPKDFTIKNAAGQAAERSKLWEKGMQHANHLEAVLELYKSRKSKRSPARSLSL